jgi:transposase
LICGWLTNSPDRNPSELLWTILKNIMAKLGPKTVDKLKQVLFQAWDSISQATIRRLYRIFEARLWICLDLEGPSISERL